MVAEDVAADGDDVDVTVVIPAWRATDTVGRAAASALEDSGPSVEVIVVDDCCPDGSGPAARRIGDPRIRVIMRAQNGGPSAAREDGFQAARGRWVAMLDADDVFLPGRLERLVATGDNHDLDILADDLLVVELADTLKAAPGEQKVAGVPLLGLEASMSVSFGTYAMANRLFAPGPKLGYLKPLFRREFLRTHAITHRAELRVGEDFDLVARCLVSGARMAVVPQPGYRYSVRAGSLSARIGSSEVEAMIAADRDVKTEALSVADQASWAARRRSLLEGAAYLRAIEALKASEPLTAIAALMKAPRAALLMRLPITARWSKFVCGQTPRRMGG